MIANGFIFRLFSREYDNKFNLRSLQILSISSWRRERHLAFLGYYFICIYSYASKILVTKEELITESQNDSHDRCLSWQNILRHRSNLCAWVDCSVFFTMCWLVCLSVQTSGRRTGTEGQKMGSETFNEIRKIFYALSQWCDAFQCLSFSPFFANHLYYTQVYSWMNLEQMYMPL